MAAVVAQFGDDAHWENFQAQALSHHADGEFERAAKFYARAIACIQNDQHTANEPDWQERIREIETLRQAAILKQALAT